MTELITLTALLVLASGVSLTLVPFLARRTAVYALHGSRDKLYELGENPGVRSTRLYRDLELGFNLAMNVLRDGSAWEALALFRALNRKRPAASASARASESVAEFEAVLLADPRGSEVLIRQLQHAMTQVEVALAWRVVWSSPLGWPFAAMFTGVTLLGFVVGLAKLLSSRASAARREATPATAAEEVPASVLYRLLHSDRRQASDIAESMEQANRLSTRDQGTLTALAA